MTPRRSKKDEASDIAECQRRFEAAHFDVEQIDWTGMTLEQHRVMVGVVARSHELRRELVTQEWL